MGAWQQALDASGGNGDDEIAQNLEMAKEKAARTAELNGTPIGIGAEYSFELFQPHNATMPKECAGKM